jgi:hypothetical protein
VAHAEILMLKIFFLEGFLLDFPAFFLNPKIKGFGGNGLDHNGHKRVAYAANF